MYRAAVSTTEITFGIEQEATYTMQVQGEPGFRQFFLVAQEDDRHLSLGLPKELVLLLATRLQEILERLDITSSNLNLSFPRSDAVEPGAAPQLLVQHLGLSLDQDGKLLLTAYGLPEMTHIPGEVHYPHIVLAMRLEAAKILLNHIWLAALQGRPVCVVCKKPLTSGHICKED